jgi:hypothetical protein
MSVLLKYVTMLMQLIPILIDIIKKLEEMFPGPGLGAEKLALAQDILSTSADISGELKDVISANWAKVASLISKIVALFNKREWKNTDNPLVAP